MYKAVQICIINITLSGLQYLKTYFIKKNLLEYIFSSENFYVLIIFLSDHKYITCNAIFLGSINLKYSKYIFMHYDIISDLIYLFTVLYEYKGIVTKVTS